MNQFIGSICPLLIAAILVIAPLPDHLSHHAAPPCTEDCPEDPEEYRPSRLGEGF